MEDRRDKTAFTLIELLVVIAILALLIGILMPSLARVKMQAQIMRVHSDLRVITIGLQMYLTDNRDQLPPTRFSCASRIEYELPQELAAHQYLPSDEKGSVLKVNVDDPFNPGNTYLYRAPGAGIVNGFTLMPDAASLYVPDGFPIVTTSQTGQYYYDPKTSPVSYAVWSVGPNVNSPKFALNPGQAPVPSRFWCMNSGDTGVIVRFEGTNGLTYTSP